MNHHQGTLCTAFEGIHCIASGDLRSVAVKTRAFIDARQDGNVLIFDDSNSRAIEVDFRGTVEDVIDRIAPAPSEAAADSEDGQRRPDRPKLGVVAREVTLLPRHWDWLDSQPSGASVALRKLVEKARRDSEDMNRVRLAQEAAYRFMNAVAGNLPDFEEAIRALFAGNEERFHATIEPWPPDVRAHATKLATAAFAGPAAKASP